MKKYLFALAVICCLMSCSGNIENEACVQMEKTIKSLAKDPNAQISDTKVVFKTDSLIALQCVLKGVNGFGGYTRSEMEYIYGLYHDGKRMEHLIDLEDDESVVKSCIDFYKKDHPKENIDDKTKEIGINIGLYLLIAGHEVDN